MYNITVYVGRNQHYYQGSRSDCLDYLVKVLQDYGIEAMAIGDYRYVLEDLR